MFLSKDQFAPLIPHAGAMNLLDRVLACDADGIHCASGSHRAADHPLRRGGRLSVLAGIEYAAQAMALHGALTGGGRRPGFLGLVKDVDLFAERLDDIPDDLEIHASRMAEQPDSLMYRFEVAAGQRLLLKGRVAVFFGETPAPWGETGP